MGFPWPLHGLDRRHLALAGEVMTTLLPRDSGARAAFGTNSARGAQRQVEVCKGLSAFAGVGFGEGQSPSLIQPPRLISAPAGQCLSDRASRQASLRSSQSRKRYQLPIAGRNQGLPA